MTQDELKQAVARAARDYVADRLPAGAILGVGTGSTANFFIDEIAAIKDRLGGTVASSEATAKRLSGHGIRVLDLNDIDAMGIYVDGADEIDHGLALVKGARRGLVAAGLAMALLTWLPSLAATLDKGLLAERYLYLPLFGLALALAAALPPRPSPALLVLALPAVLVLHARLPDWKDSKSVWEAAQRDTPSPFTGAGLGWYRHRDGDLDGAIPLLEQAVLGDPPYRDACELVLMALLEAHREPEAVALGQRLLQEGRCGPGGLLPHHLAIAQAGEGLWAEALATAQSIPGGPGGPSLVVIGAERARRGDLAGLSALARAQPDPVAFVQNSARLLRLGGQPAAADAALTLLRREPP